MQDIYPSRHADVAEFLPRLDPVVHSDWSEDAPISRAQAEQFDRDGYLFITLGDRGEMERAQNPGDHNGSVIRLHDDGRVPKDNPFVEMKGARPETWAYGFRNPWRITCDRKTGDIWVGNNGQDLWEQVYFVRKGENYGWSVQEGGHPFYLERKRGPQPITPPAADHPQLQWLTP